MKQKTHKSMKKSKVTGTGKYMRRRSHNLTQVSKKFWHGKTKARCETSSGDSKKIRKLLVNMVRIKSSVQVKNLKKVLRKLKVIRVLK